MILLLDTSTPTCRLTFVDGQRSYEASWEADRQLAKGLLGYLSEQLAIHAWTWNDITALGVFQGPGSFTGLRIGLTVLNTIADTKQLSIVGTKDADWQATALERLRRGDNDRIVLPFYGAEANITKPRK